MHNWKLETEGCILFYLIEFLEAHQDLWGITRHDLTPKPAFVALANMIGLLDRPTSGRYKIRGTESNQLSKSELADLPKAFPKK